MQDNIEQRIRERAYQIWEHEGRPDGRAEHHWEQACALIAREDEVARGQKVGSAKSASD
jgi:hypothetical protein